MRLSSSLLVILAAITMANAATVVDSATHPKHKLVRVKNGKAHVNALDAAKVKVHPDVKHLKNLVKVAAKRGVDISNLSLVKSDAADAKVNAVDLKHVAGIVHTLSASVESQTKDADSVLKIKDQKLAAVQADKLFSNIKATLATAVVDIHSLSGKTTHEKVAKIALLQRNILEAVDLNHVTSMISSANIAGAGNLVTLLSGIKVDSVLQGDVLSVLTDADIMHTIHSVANVDTVLSSIVAVPAAVPLVESLQELDSPTDFVAALVDIKSITSLVAAAPQGVDSISKVDGSKKLMAYIDRFGSTTAFRIFTTAGVENVLTSVTAVPGSVELLKSIKGVADVPAFVSGLQVLNVASFVSSVKAVDNVSSLTSVLTVLNGVAPLGKRADLLQSVQSSIAGLDVAKLVNIKRALAHIAALPDSQLASIDQAVGKREILNNVDLGAALAGLDVAQIDLLKRSIVDLSMLSEKEIDALRGAMKRDVLSSLNINSLTGADGLLGNVDALKLVNRDILSDLPVGGKILGTVKGTVGPATQHLPAHDAVEKVKREVLGALTGSGSGDLLGEGGAGLDLVDMQGGPLAGIGGAGDGLLGSGGGAMKFLDVNRILAAAKRSDLLAPVMGNTISDLDLAKILPALKREIIDADAATSPADEALWMVNSGLARRNTEAVDATVSITLLEDAIDTLTVDIAALLTRVVSITDAVHVDAITTDVKTEVVPMVAAVAKVLENVVSVKAPKLTSKVNKVTSLADKTTQSLH